VINGSAYKAVSRGKAGERVGVSVGRPGSANCTVAAAQHLEARSQRRNEHASLLLSPFTAKAERRSRMETQLCSSRCPRCLIISSVGVRKSLWSRGWAKCETSFHRERRKREFFVTPGRPDLSTLPCFIFADVNQGESPKKSSVRYTDGKRATIGQPGSGW